MAHELINGGAGSRIHKPGETVYELAEDLLDDVSDWIVALKQVQRMLDKLAELRPSEEDDDCY